MYIGVISTVFLVIKTYKIYIHVKFIVCQRLSLYGNIRAISLFSSRSKCRCFWKRITNLIFYSISICRNAIRKSIRNMGSKCVSITGRRIGNCVVFQPSYTRTGRNRTLLGVLMIVRFIIYASVSRFDSRSIR